MIEDRTRDRILSLYRRMYGETPPAVFRALEPADVGRERWVWKKTTDLLTVPDGRLVVITGVCSYLLLTVAILKLPGIPVYTFATGNCPLLEPLVLVPGKYWAEVTNEQGPVPPEYTFNLVGVTVEPLGETIHPMV